MRLRGMIQIGVGAFVMGGILFGSSDHLNWMPVWILRAIFLISSSIMVWKVSPELLEERSHLKEGAKRWDLISLPLSLLW